MLLSCIRLGVTIIVVMLFHWYVMNNKSVFMCHVCIGRGVITINVHSLAVNQCRGSGNC